MNLNHEQQRALMLRQLAEENPLAFIEIAGLLSSGKSDAEINAQFAEILARHPSVRERFAEPNPE